MSKFIFPTEFVFWCPNPLHENHKELLLKKIHKHARNVKPLPEDWGSLLTEYETRDANTDRYRHLINQAIFPSLMKMYTEIPNIFCHRDPYISQIWYNHYPKSHTTWLNPHCHPTGIISGLYFLELHEPCTTVFYSNLSAMNQMSMPHLHADFVVEGDILLFPSSLTHYVLPSQQQKTTIAFDINFKNLGEKHDQRSL